MKEFRYLIVIANEGTLSKAAQVLYTSQPALSQFLNGIDDQLGFEVFKRTTHGLTPTEQGSKYLSMISDVVARYDSQMVDFISSYDKKRIIRLGIADQRGYLMLPSILYNAEKVAPKVKLQANDAFSSRQEMLDELGRDNLDIVCTTTFGTDPSLYGFNIYPLVKEELVLAVPQGHPLFKRATTGPGGYKHTTLESLSNERFVFCSTRRYLGCFVDWLFSGKHISPVVSLRSNNISTMLRISQANCLLTIVPVGYIQHVDGFRFFSIGSEGVYWLHVALSSKNNSNNYMDSILKVLESSFREKNQIDI